MKKNPWAMRGQMTTGRLKVSQNEVQIMKIIFSVIILSVLWLIVFLGSSPAEPLTSLPADETSSSISKSDEAVPVSEATISPEPSTLEEPTETIPDPLEPINRVFFHVNDRLYFWVFKPVAKGYKAVLPQDVRVGLRNFFSNLTTPIRLVNCLLQAKLKCAANETGRFLLNTTFGMAGFLDPAKKEFSIEKHEEDFGTTLGFWGIGPTFYIEWPVLGPSSLRDTLGYAGDIFLDPRTYLLSPIPIVDMSLWSLDKVNETSLTIGEYEDLIKAALDPYIAVREAFHQYRQSKIREK
jgi:phospholipid-binding lipoprotein MlaA